MGNSQTTQNHIDFTDLSTHYSYETKYNDHRFGEIKLLKRKDTGERIFQKDFSSNSAKEFDDYVNKIKTRLPLLHPNILKVLGYNSKKEDLFCADFYKISLFFESFETDLEKEIYRRETTKNYFTETELRNLLDSVIAAGAFLQNNQLAHGDLRPFNIFITKNREYKLCDSSLFQSTYNPSYFGLLEGLEARSHNPSPQVFKHYQARQGKATDFNQYKNDVYGLGMSVLSAARLEKIDNAYDYDKKQVKQDVVGNHLNKLRDQYSDGFIDALRVLLSPEEAQRPDFLELNDEIKGYRLDTRSKANLERMLESRKIESESRKVELERRKNSESPLKSGAPGAAATVNPLYIDDELDKRVRKAVQRSEEMANKSPSKYKNEVIDNCIKTYLQKDPMPQDYPLLYTISPHLTMENRFVPTLKVYSQENPGLGASHYNVADVGSNLYASPDVGAYNNYGHDVRGSQNQPGGSFAGNVSGNVTDNYGGYQPQGNSQYGQGNAQYGQGNAQYGQGNEHYGQGNTQGGYGQYDQGLRPDEGYHNNQWNGQNDSNVQRLY